MAGFPSVWRRSVGVLIAVLLALAMLPQTAARATSKLAPTATAQANGFPEGYFFIRNAASGLALDVDGGSTEPGASVILWPRKADGYDNQLWKYDQGFLVNKASGLVVEVPGYEGGGNIQPGTPVAQGERRERPDNLNQLWAENYRHMMPYDPKVTLWGEGGNVSLPGTRVVVDTSFSNEVTQEWEFEMP
ncbi:RICIN domain-containing protein [Streptomyces caeruleatus]|uniref:Ricin B lectin domain-containing protein n=1 Tax=Streptomyces caeruleatus TaxID=661399 RepID=A0A117RN78_9ACTN|nr:RICIN domain-containing protein [Streptomyces caeruleatus]KUO00064.1 hypothetical protein AQJ67_24705 [Streptomyces caeruleatus]